MGRYRTRLMLTCACLDFLFAPRRSKMLSVGLCIMPRDDKYGRPVRTGTEHTKNTNVELFLLLLKVILMYV
jgi:hypothetical protein